MRPHIEDEYYYIQEKSMSSNRWVELAGHYPDKKSAQKGLALLMMSSRKEHRLVKRVIIEEVID